MSDASLLPSNQTSLEQALAQLSSGDRSLANVLRYMHSVDTCPAAMLPWLAIQRSVDRWDPQWSETVKRKVVKDAFEVHKRKGTLGALRRVVEPFADILDITEWHQLEPMGAPGTFTMSLALFDSGLSDTAIAELERMINDTKPISRHLVGLNITYSPSGTYYIGAGISSGDEVTISSPELWSDDLDVIDLELSANDLYYFANFALPGLLRVT
ncbi:phage tail protein [Pseudomonas endophytica]|uniref:Phage tail protein n=1 Tax=Pseudomonas endophytica TaxID=1563157 RepID=A0A0N8VRV5_9PSED|nr:phage tail protein I [Pseudomonas endophytica]KQB51580.1 phage tail protein [Pseudomonas endophytica]